VNSTHYHNLFWVKMVKLKIGDFSHFHQIASPKKPKNGFGEVAKNARRGKYWFGSVESFSVRLTKIIS
jgi:hypothetical protein